jgi:hypothetical protein
VALAIRGSKFADPQDYCVGGVEDAQVANGSDPALLVLLSDPSDADSPT